MILESLITCPHCATAKMETMPTDACRFFYTCSGCGVTLQPEQGDCCVFCSYGSVPCPPISGGAFGRDRFGFMLYGGSHSVVADSVQSSREWLRSRRTNRLAWWIPQAGGTRACKRSMSF